MAGAQELFEGVVAVFEFPLEQVGEHDAEVEGHPRQRDATHAGYFARLAEFCGELCCQQAQIHDHSMRMNNYLRYRTLCRWP